MSFKKLLSLILIALAIFICGAIALTYRSDLPAEELMQKYVLPASGWMMLHEQNIHFTDEGIGPAVLLIHGTSSSLHTWNGWTKNLREDHRVIRIDLPGFGLSGPHPDHDYSEEAYLELFEELRDALSIQKWTVAGNSFGGFLAASYAEKHPTRTNGLVLINSSGWPQENKPFNIFDLAKGPLGEILIHCSPKIMVERSLHNVYGNPEKVDQELIDRHYNLLLFPGNRSALRKRLNTSDSEWSTERSLKMKMPILFIWGEKDPWISTENGRSWSQAFPNSNFVSFPESGHVPMEEQPIETVTSFREWEAQQNAVSFP